MRQLIFIATVVLCSNTWAAEVSCLVADFRAALDVPAPIREAAAHNWIEARAGDCSYEQLTAMKNNLGNWMGVANSNRVTVQLLRHIESYFIAKNEWSENLYTSKAAYVAPYNARTLTATTNVIVSPPPIPEDDFGQPVQQNNGYPNMFDTAPPSNQKYGQPPQTDPNNNRFQNTYPPAPQEQYADPNSDR